MMALVVVTRASPFARAASKSERRASCRVCSAVGVTSPEATARPSSVSACRSTPASAPAKNEPNSRIWIWFGIRMPFVAAQTAETASESRRYQRM